MGYREYAYQVPISTYYSNYNRGFIVFLSYIAQLYRYRKYYLYCYTTNLLVVIPREPFKKNIQMFYPYNFMSAVTRWRVLKVMSYARLLVAYKCSCQSPSRKQAIYCTVLYLKEEGVKVSGALRPPEGARRIPSASHTHTHTHSLAKTQCIFGNENFQVCMATSDVSGSTGSYCNGRVFLLR